MMHKRLTIILLGIVLLSSAQGQTVKELQKQQQQIMEEIAQTGKMIDQTKKNEKATVNKLNLLNKDIKDRKRLISNINSEITALDNEMLSLNVERATLQDELEKLKGDYADLVRKTHYADMQSTPLLFLFSSKDFQQLMRRIRYMSEFAQYRKQQVAQIEHTQAEIDLKNEQLANNKEDKEKALNVQKRERDNLARDERKQEQMLKELKKKKSSLIAQQKKQQKKADELNKKIEQLIRSQVQPKDRLTPEQKLIAGGFEANKGKLPWPIEKGFISGYFGIHQHPVYENVTINNKGIYLQTTAGSNARAVYDGEVSSCVVLGNAYAVIVQHGNYRTVYSNIKELYVKQGDKLTAKQKIGKIISDPEEDNKTELYFQIYKDLEIQNPSLWLAQ